MPNDPKFVPFTTADACWCQPFDGPAHPECPMHGNPNRPNQFASIGLRVMLADRAVCTAVSNNMAKRIANALNSYTPDRRGL